MGAAMVAAVGLTSNPVFPPCLSTALHCEGYSCPLQRLCSVANCASPVAFPITHWVGSFKWQLPCECNHFISRDLFLWCILREAYCRYHQCRGGLKDPGHKETTGPAAEGTERAGEDGRDPARQVRGCPEFCQDLMQKSVVEEQLAFLSGVVEWTKPQRRSKSAWQVLRDCTFY